MRRPTRRAHRDASSDVHLDQLRNEHAAEIAARAEAAGSTVVRLFGRRALGVPGTLLGAVQIPEIRTWSKRLGEWHYWWQAHFVDCAIDAAYRAHTSHDSQSATAWYERAHALLLGIRVRNLGLFVNSYYDDMAWLTLAAGRLNALSQLLFGRGDLLAQQAGQALYPALARGLDDDGGIFWSTQRDFKNTPAAAPAALAFVRGHQPERAGQLLDWLDRHLWDAESNVFLDGVRLRGEGEYEVERSFFSYNQGPVLSALLEIAEAGGPLAFDAAERIERIVDGIETHFGEEFEISPAESLPVLKMHGNGDGGLFTGILGRYLAQVALSDAVEDSVRTRAADLVVYTAEVLWEGRREFDPDLPLNEAGIDVNEIRGEAAVLFSPDVMKHSSETLRAGAPVELSSQLQAWMLLEASARVIAAAS